MEMENNRIPDRVGSIHLTAVCGTGMGALAAMLKDLGYTVTGSDQDVYPPMSTFLAEKRIEVMSGFDEQNLAHRPDLVVIGNTVKKENPEARAALASGLPFCSMPQALNRLVASGKKRLVVAGTHGKTTTASLLAWVLQTAGADPSFMIGGIVKNFASNYRIGDGPFMVIEGDEYDTAFFDKGPKFLHYPPHGAILTGIEFDHADIYRDLDHVRSAFSRFLDIFPEDGRLLAFSGDGNVDAVCRDRRFPVIRYGPDGADWRIGPGRVDPPWTTFQVFRDGRRWSEPFRTRMVGEHNRFNALGVIALADQLGLDPAAVRKGVETFEGARRRQEIRGIRNGITVMDDFAHHPTAVRETIRGVKAGCPGKRLIAVFEPRTHSSMRGVFQEIYPDAFDDADRICVRHPALLHKVPENDRFSSEKLVDDLCRKGKDARYFPDTDAILDFLEKTLRPGDLVLIMSNGGFDDIHERLLERL